MRVLLYSFLMDALVKACARGCSKAEGPIASEILLKGGERLAKRI